MAQPPNKKPTKPQAKDASELDSFFDEFFENHQPQLEETPESEQQRQWISDQLMWETTLGMREDETIQRAITPGDDSIPETGADAGPAPVNRTLSQRERSLLRTQVHDPAPNAAPKNPQPSAGKQSPPQEVAPPPRRPAQSDVVSKAPVQPVMRAPVQQPPARKPPPSETQRRQSARAERPAQPVQRPAAARANTPSQAQPARRRKNSGEATAHPSRRQQASSAAVQTRTAAPRKAPHPQDLAIDHLSSAAAAETIVLDSDLVTGWERNLAKIKNALAILGVAAISFVSGYYVGQPDSPAEITPDVPTAPAGTAEPALDANAQPVAKKTLKTFNPKPTPAPIAPVAPVESVPNAGGDSAADSGAVFEGKDIPIEPAEPVPPQATVEGDTQGNTAPLQAAPEDFASEPATANFLQSGMPTQSNDPVQTQALLDQSLRLFQEKQWQELIKLSDQILARDPGAITALTNRAAAHTELGNYLQALADCNQAVKLAPGHPLAYNNRGYVYEKMGDLPNTVADYQKACDLGLELSCKEVQRLKRAPQ